MNSSWHGPDELDYSLAGCQGIVTRLRALPGAWYGRLRTQAPGGLPLTFWGTARDMDDAGLATLDLEGSEGGPLLSMLIVPAQRRHLVRGDLAFEFVSYLRFLEGQVGAGAEMAIHDHIEQHLSGADRLKTLVFSVESRFVEDETRIALCEQADRLAVSLIASMAERDAVRIQTASKA